MREVTVQHVPRQMTFVELVAEKKIVERVSLLLRAVIEWMMFALCVMNVVFVPSVLMVAGNNDILTISLIKVLSYIGIWFATCFVVGNRWFGSMMDDVGDKLFAMFLAMMVGHIGFVLSTLILETFLGLILAQLS